MRGGCIRRLIEVERIKSHEKKKNGRNAKWKHTVIFLFNFNVNNDDDDDDDDDYNNNFYSKTQPGRLFINGKFDPASQSLSSYNFLNCCFFTLWTVRTKNP